MHERYDVAADVREIIRQEIEDSGKSQNALAKEWGMSQTRLNDFLNGSGWNLDQLSSVLTGLGVSPVDFFLRSPRYEAQQRVGVVAKIRNLLPEEELKRWAEIIQRLQRAELYGPLMDGISSFLNELEIRGLKRRR